MAGSKRGSQKGEASKRGARTKERAGATAPPKRAPDVLAEVDADAKRKYDALLATIVASKGKESLMFDRLWEAAGEIVSRRLYLVGGYESADEFFREVMREEPRTAYRWILVARYASPREEERYGPTKLYAALKHVEKKIGHPVEHAPLPIAFDELRIDVRGKKLTLEDATVDQIDQATRALAGEKRTARDPSQRALEAALGEVSSLADVRVTVRGGVASFAGVPIAALSRFADAVRSATFDAQPPPKKGAKKGAKKRGKPA